MYRRGRKSGVFASISRPACWLLALVIISILILSIKASQHSSSSSSNSRSSSSSSSNTKTNSLRYNTVKMSSTVSAADSFLIPPPMIYGTAWKKDHTEELVKEAIRSGFRWFDTACQPKHYNEKGLGDAIASSGVKRSDFFIQTKFTPTGGQDPKSIPYDNSLPLAQQVKQSLQRSLENLQTPYVNSLLLHSPLETVQETMEVYRQFEEFIGEKKVLYIGISNLYDLALLKEIYSKAVVKPTFLQNRFYKKSGYDVEIRAFCREKGIHYQSFWTLSANPLILKSSTVTAISSRLGKTPEQVFFAFTRSQGMIFLTGTKDSKHMAEDLDVPNIVLLGEDVAAIEKELM